MKAIGGDGDGRRKQLLLSCGSSCHRGRSHKNVSCILNSKYADFISRERSNLHQERVVRQ
jgi:hypothetical protein